jgi:hypothetical protein
LSTYSASLSTFKIGVLLDPHVTSGKGGEVVERPMTFYATEGHHH